MNFEKCSAINKECKFYAVGYQKDQYDVEILLTFCNNPDNKNKFEGNTTKKLCPLKKYLPSDLYLGKTC